MRFWKITIPLALTAVAGLIPIVAFFASTEQTGVQEAKNKLETYMIVIASFALLLGVVNVVQSNVKKIERRQKGWQYGAFLLAGLIGMAIPGLLGAMRVGSFQGIGYRPDGSATPFQWMAEFVFT